MRAWRESRAEQQGITQRRKAKLVPDQVRQIRVLYSSGGVSMGRLAKQFGVSGALVQGIVRRRFWKEIP